jgi:Bacterial protein of unknown function (DUF899)
LGAFNWLDLTPKGRNESGIMSWARLHDEYDTNGADACCHSGARRAEPALAPRADPRREHQDFR